MTSGVGIEIDVDEHGRGVFRLNGVDITSRVTSMSIRMAAKWPPKVTLDLIPSYVSFAADKGSGVEVVGRRDQDGNLDAYVITGDPS